MINGLAAGTTGAKIMLDANSLRTHQMAQCQWPKKGQTDQTANFPILQSSHVRQQKDSDGIAASSEQSKDISLSLCLRRNRDALVVMRDRVPPLEYTKGASHVLDCRSVQVEPI